MAKQLACQRYIYKIRSSRLRKAKWNLTLPLSEARRNDELISLADSQVLRWLDELNGIKDADSQARELKAEIRRVRKESNSLQNRRKLRKLYEQLDALQFKPDYLCVIMDKEKDYIRACRGFKINGVKYHRLLGTNGGVKNSTIVFVSDRHSAELRRRIDNGRNPEMELVAAKLEAYKALTCSASNPVSMPHGILVVPDCETEFISDIVYLNDEGDGEPVMEERKGVPVQLDESDGYGIMLPSLADRWAKELGLDYRPSGVNTRFAWEKGMVFCFDFLEFAEQVAKSYIVKDAWGNEKDIRDVELILTTSMVKLWDSYPSCEEYVRNCMENKYSFGVAKVCPKALESERNLNYQFIQSYDLSDEDIDRLIAPTMNEIRDVLSDDWRKTILFLKGAGLNENNVCRIDNDYAKAIMIDQRMIDDPFVQSELFSLIKTRINEAKVGVVKVHGNYSIVSGDPYSLCQSIFGMEVTGILKAGEIYNGYWVDTASRRLACFRAPMTCHNNVRAVMVNDSDEARHWYRNMVACTVFNSWDTAAHALNGMDKDGDLVLLTDNQVLVNKLRPLPALMCVQRKAKKRIVTEEDAIRANINSFGDDIGKITNRITAMFEVQSKFKPGSPEYEELDYRIKCGQLFQQNAIDKAKGIIAKPMPRSWHDRHYALAIEDVERRKLYLSILADKKPYFMRYIYPDLAKQYNTYIKNTNKKAKRQFQMTIDELLELDHMKLDDEQAEFIHYYTKCMPVGVGDCVTNRICKRFEAAFDGYVGKHNSTTGFDYTIMKSGAEYTQTQYSTILRLYEDYTKRLHSYAVYAARERVDADEVLSHISMMKHEFSESCGQVCSNSTTLCDIMLDICYKRSSSKRFVWSICHNEIIDNLLRNTGGVIHFPVLAQDGDIEFCGNRFVLCEKEIGGNEWASS